MLPNELINRIKDVSIPLRKFRKEAGAYITHDGLNVSIPLRKFRKPLRV